MVQSKPKGNNYENTIAQIIRKKFIPAQFDAKISHSLVHRTPMSGGHVEKGDLVIKPPVWKYFPWFFECRNRESWSWKNVMEKGTGSVIGKWFQEDAIDKCHPYDNDASYPRYPLLLFTRNFEKQYVCARMVDIVSESLEVGEPAVWFNEGKWVIYSFDQFLAGYEGTPYGIIDDINKYLGVDNGNTESPDPS
jgi:hypothetical protein